MNRETTYSTQARSPRERILAMAERQVLRIGHEKTRVVDVAKAAGMSHANVYRFFESRQQLMEAVAARWLKRSEEVLANSLQASGTPGARLERGVLALLRHRHRQRKDAGGVDRVVTLVLAESGELSRRHHANLRHQLAEVIAEGLNSGEFQGGGAAALAQAVLDATAAFHDPILLGRTAPRALAGRAKAVVGLLLRGLEA